VLSLLASNLEYVAVAEATRAMLAASLLAVALTLLAWLFLRDSRKAGLAATPLLLLLLSYGHLYSGLKSLLGALIVRHRYLAPLLVMASGGWALLVRRRLRNAAPLTLAFNLMGAVALLNPLIVVLRDGLSDPSPAVAGQPAEAVESVTLDATEGRDIFYIVLDGYGRQDVLLDIYNHDNRPFLEALSQRGFRVLERGFSNYIVTTLSLASALNMEYMDTLERERPASERFSNPWFVDLIWHSRVRELLAQQGYGMIAFRTAFPYTSVTDAEIFWYPEGQADEEEQSSPQTRANAFEALLVERSLAKVALDHSLAAREAMNRFVYAPLYEEHRSRILLTLERLADVPALPGRHFVLAHIISPHPPFVFDAEGAPLTPGYPFSFADASALRDYGYGTRADYITGYREQLRYLNGLVISAIDEVLARSEQPPIIILQGDHGPGAYTRWNAIMDSNLVERAGILNALLLPGAPPDVLYPTITPVNSFRLVLSLYFGADLPPLADCTYFSSFIRRERLRQAWDCTAPGSDWTGLPPIP
jgi:hypothetical protein